MPLTTELVAIKRKIMFKTPRAELIARVKELEQATASLPPHPSPDQFLLKSDLADLKHHLATTEEPHTFKTFLVLVAIASAFIFVPRLVYDWLSS